MKKVTPTEFNVLYLVNERLKDHLKKEIVTRKSYTYCKNNQNFNGQNVVFG